MTVFENLIKSMPSGRLKSLMYLYSRGGRSNEVAKIVVEMELKRRGKNEELN